MDSVRLGGRARRRPHVVVRRVLDAGALRGCAPYRSARGEMAPLELPHGARARVPGDSGAPEDAPRRPEVRNHGGHPLPVSGRGVGEAPVPVPFAPDADLGGARAARGGGRGDRKPRHQPRRAPLLAAPRGAVAGAHRVAPRARGAARPALSGLRVPQRRLRARVAGRSRQRRIRSRLHDPCGADRRINVPLPAAAARGAPLAPAVRPRPVVAGSPAPAGAGPRQRSRRPP